MEILFLACGMEQEIPDYDMDSEDEGWVDQQSKKMEISPLKFEEMMDRLEKGSGQQVKSVLIPTCLPLQSFFLYF